MPYKIEELTPEVIESLKAENPGVELHQVSAEGLEVLVLVRAPSKFEYKRFRDLAAKNKEDKAQETLVNDCLIYPKGQEWLDLLEDLPGLPDTVSGVILNLAGVYQNAEAKKF